MPRNSTGAYAFKWEYLISSFLSKLPADRYSSEYRRDAAIKKMLETEDNCRTINEDGYFYQGFAYQAEWCNTVLSRAANIVDRIFGDLNYEIFETAGFSSGATTSRRRRKGDPYYKYSKSFPVHCTPQAHPYGIALRGLTPMWYEYGSTITCVPGNRISTVPKKTEIDRCIAMEPDVNMALQLSVGRYLRRRLLKFGIDIRDQTLNQRLAREGSINDNLATIDLSAASDSLSIRLVRDLLTPDWFALLDDLRSQKGQLPDGKEIVWEKFSSMGNGFTFELETIIFYALSRAAIEEEVLAESNSLEGYSHHHTLSVYGDDIICPSKYADNVIMILRNVGFATNVEKTFTRGPFRESCGKHYYNGYDVTPIYVRKPIDRLQRYVWFANALRLWAADDDVCDPSVWNIWRKFTKTFIPRRLMGGKDIRSSSNVCSPGKVKDQLTSKITMRKINGPIAVLRWLQFAPPISVREWVVPLQGRTPRQILWSFLNDDCLIDEWYSDSKWGQYILAPIPDSYRFKPAESQWGEIPMFPKET
jgi:hypothetical protein